MNDEESPVALGRFRNLEFDSAEPKAGAQKRLPDLDDSASPEAILKKFLLVCLKEIDSRERVRRLTRGLVEGSAEALLEPGSSAIDVQCEKWLTKHLASLPPKDKKKFQKSFPPAAGELLNQAVVDIVAQAREGGETSARERFEAEKQGLLDQKQQLENRVDSLRRALRVFRSRFMSIALFGALIAASVGFTVWLVGLLEPEVARVTIEYNIGEIIVAILGGAGAAAAGVAYAVKTLSSPTEPERRG